jgi:hypothetical protein
MLYNCMILKICHLEHEKGLNILIMKTRLYSQEGYIWYENFD